MGGHFGAPHLPKSLRLLLARSERLGMGLGPLEAFLQLLLGLLHELERLRAVAVVVVGGFLELLFRALEIANGGVHVRMTAGARRSLALRRRRRRGRGRR